MAPDRWRQIDVLCRDALDRDPVGRAAFLDRACAGDPALRRDVESLLAWQSRTAGFLQQPAFDAHAAVPASASLLQPAAPGPDRALPAGDAPTATTVSRPRSSASSHTPTAAFDTSGTRATGGLLRDTMQFLASRFGRLPGPGAFDARPLRHYLRQAIQERVAGSPPPAGAVDPEDARRYHRACARLSPPDRELIVATIIRAERVPDLRQFRPDCPEPVAAAFENMLAVNRDLRPRTAAAFREILERAART